jgi:GTP pyrophosphokinase
MPTIRLEDIVERLQRANPGADVDLVRRAYIFSAKAHHGQNRLSGETYLNHPIEVANILADLKLDPATVAAGILHDTVEDTTSTIEEIKALFGDEVAQLVDGMTKLSRMELQSREEREAQNFRKMIVAMAKDLRVILIKLADRLHNMRTLKFLPPEKQKRTAQETLDIYAPLANRLGIQKFKTELEDLSFQYLHSEEYRDIANNMAKKRVERQAYIDELIEIVRGQLAEHGFKGEVKGRPKHFWSIWQKMQKQDISFDDVYDLIAVRIITDTKVNCYAILGLIHSLWTPVPGRFKDFIGVPKSNLYQSLHTTVIGPRASGWSSARTDEMHRLAEEHRSALAVQGTVRPEPEGRAAVRLAPPAPGMAERPPGRQGVHGDGQGRPLSGRGLCLHPQGRREGIAAGFNACRLRVQRPYRHRASMRRGQDQRQDCSAQVCSDERRQGRDRHPGRPHAEQGLAQIR